MRVALLFWLLCYFALIDGAPSPPVEEDGGGATKESEDTEESRIDVETTLSPSELGADFSENWDQSKEDNPSSLFLNKSDKNDLEPYPMALSETGGEVFDGQRESDGETFPPKPGALERAILMPEYYGEPPSMGRDSLRRKRSSFRSNPGYKVSKRGIKYSVARVKRDADLWDDVRALYALHQALEGNQRQRYQQPAEESNWRKRQWTVKKKRSDLYTLSELLRGSQNAAINMPITRRRFL